MKVLFVCEGNAMRSPMAAAFYNYITGTEDAVSAGAAPSPVGGAPFPEVVAAMEERGIDVASCKSRPVTTELVDWADLVIAFPTPLMPDFVRRSPKTIRWEVTDPFYAPHNGVDYVRLARDEIEKRVEKLIKEGV